MNDRDDQDWNEREVLAAEYALGVLEGSERRTAEDFLVRDADFAAAVARWRAELDPMIESAAAVTPPADLWRRIEAQVAPAPARAATSTATPKPGLWSSVAFWRGLSFATTAAAAVFAALLVSPQPVTTPVPVPTQPTLQPAIVGPMAAAPVMMEDGGALLAAAYDPGRRRFVVTPTGRYALEPSQDLELWVIVGDKAPRSLGVIDPAHSRAYALPDDVRADLAAGATLAVSIEPTGGSPTGAPTGAVVASGKLTQI